jgi:hypothetical protein
MAQVTPIRFSRFRGIRNDENSKEISPEYFFNIKNFNFHETGITGLEKTLNPERVLQFDNANIDGAFEYRYRDENDILQTEYIVINNGKIFKTDLISTKIELKTGLTAGLTTAVVFNDELYMANGKDYVQVYNGNKGIVYEMGSPIAEESTVTGSPNGTYYYAMTYVTAGGEEVIGSVSNTLTVLNKRITLTLPIGYAGTISRKIYRTATGGTQLKLLTTIANNTTLTYTDNIADGSLGANILALNNELPKPYFLTVQGQKIYGAAVDKYPTQIFPTDVNIAVFDTASGLDVAGYGLDNTPVKGIGIDFGRVIAFTGKNVFIINPSDNSIVTTRANVGIKSGYSVASVPASGEFQGGLMFVSTLNDVRVMSGLQALPVATSLDNVRTDNWSQTIRGDLQAELKVLNNIYATFYNYRYHLVINSIKFVFDIRVQGWTEHEVRTTSYTSTPLVLSVLNNSLYNGQSDGWLEREYADIQYRDEEVEGVLETPHISVNEYFKVIENFKLWFIPSDDNKMTFTVITDDNNKFAETITFSVDGGVYEFSDFSENFYDVDEAGMDYRTVNINKTCRWLKWILRVTEGNISFQEYTLIGQGLVNKEG